MAATFDVDAVSPCLHRTAGLMPEMGTARVPKAAKPTCCDRVVKTLKLRWFQYRIVSGMYVLSWWEACLLNAVFMLIIWLFSKVLLRVIAFIFGEWLNCDCGYIFCDCENSWV